MNSLLSHGLGIVYWIVMLPAFYLSGSIVKCWLEFLTEPFRGILFYALGAGLFAAFIILLSGFHLLTAPFLILFPIVIIILFRRRINDFLNWLSSIKVQFSFSSSITDNIAIALWLFSMAFTLALCFLPETGGDAVTYQLYLPKVFAKYSSASPIPAAGLRRRPTT